MKKNVILCLMAFVGATVSQAQITLPTKKTTGTATPVKKEVNKSPKTQSGTVTLPTVKKETTGETTTGQTPATEAAPVLAGGVIKPLPVVVRKTAPRAKPIVKKPKPEDNEIYESAEHMPTYPGGVAELMKFINENLQYPSEAISDSTVENNTIIQVSFIVEKDGSPKDFQVIDEHNPYLEAEAVRVLQEMPKWKPATQKGVKVRVEYVVPVKFNKPNQ